MDLWYYAFPLGPHFEFAISGLGLEVAMMPGVRGLLSARSENDQETAWRIELPGSFKCCPFESCACEETYRLVSS